VDWIHLSQDRNMWQALVDMVMNLQMPQNAGNFLTSTGKFNFSSKVLLHRDLIIREITQSTILIHPSYCTVKSLFSDAKKSVCSLRISLAQPAYA
jgi:phenylalanine-4-hydroxylase